MQYLTKYLTILMDLQFTQDIVLNAKILVLEQIVNAFPFKFYSSPKASCYKEPGQTQTSYKFPYLFISSANQLRL